MCSSYSDVASVPVVAGVRYFAITPAVASVPAADPCLLMLLLCLLLLASLLLLATLLSQGSVLLLLVRDAPRMCAVNGNLYRVTIDFYKYFKKPLICEGRVGGLTTVSNARSWEKLNVGNTNISL